MTAENSKQTPAQGTRAVVVLTPKDLATKPKEAAFKFAMAKFVAAYAAAKQVSEEVAKGRFNMEVIFFEQIYSKNDYLKSCDPQSVIDSLINVGTVGLTLAPELKLGYLIPRKGRCYFNSSYMGKREIVLRTGLVKDLWANLVYEKDEFMEIGGTDRKIIHKPVTFGDRGKILGGYWQAVLLNGEMPFGTMTIERIEEIKSRSEASKAGKGSPWETDYEEMCKKTLINNSFKHLPKTGISDDVVRAIEADNAFDNDDLEDWLKRQEAEKGSDWEKDQKTPGKKMSINFDEAVIVKDEAESKQEPRTPDESIPPEQFQEQGPKEEPPQIEDPKEPKQPGKTLL